LASATEIIRRRRRRRERKRAKIQRQHLNIGFLSVFVFIVFVVPPAILFGGAGFIYWRATNNLPTPQETVELGPAIGPTRLFDNTGQTLLFSVEDILGNEPAWVALDELPEYVVQATLQMEDPDFLEHDTGFDVGELLNDLWGNLLSGPAAPDVTLTGRLVRNVISPQPEFITVDYRADEIAQVAELNRRYSPEQILEWHLNTNYYGNDAFGIEAAAQTYFGKNARDLTLDEAAMLAAIPLAPQYNPFDDLVAARGRQTRLLTTMRVEGEISNEEFELAAIRNTPVQINAGQTPRLAPEFAIYARRQAEDILTASGRDGARLVSRGGLTIITSLDLDLYLQSECALRAHLARLDGREFAPVTISGGLCQADALLPEDEITVGASPPDDGLLVVIDVETGEIKSMVGAADTIAYQPGPVLHPFVYFEGFRSAEFTPASQVLDIPRNFPGSAEGLIYTPSNADGQFRGPMNLRDAMGAGLLPPAVQVANARSLNNVIRNAHSIGLNSLEEGVYDLSLLERGGEVSLLDVAYAYSVFASLGEMRGVAALDARPGFRGRDPVAVLRIEDAEGNVLWEYDDEQKRLSRTPIFDPALGYLINDILADNGTRWPVIGQETPLDLPRESAVVNGVTGNHEDAWTVGYTPRFVVGVRFGRHDGAAMTIDPFNLQGTAPVWNAVMEYLHIRDQIPATSWERPANVVETGVCERSGLAPNGVCPVRREIFLQNTQPVVQDTFWQSIEVNSQTQRLVTANTPSSLRTEQVFYIPPAEAIDWWRANNLPLPPEEFDFESRPDILGSAAILEPAPFEYVTGVVHVRGTLDTANMQFYQVAYGRGVNPNEWVQIAESSSFDPDNNLAEWDTTGLDGLYNLRLSVVLEDNSVENKIIQVSVDNTPPEITLDAGGEGRVYRWPDESVIMLNAEVTDNLAVQRVDFFHNGERIGTDEVWPYGFEWDIRRPGTEIFNAVAFDAVGNTSSAEIVVEVQRTN